MQRYLIFAIGIVVLVVLLAPWLDNLATPDNAPAAVEEQTVGPPEIAKPVGAAAPAVPAGLVITRDGSGQFHVEAEVNNRPVRLLVDTGADGIALSEADAQAIGLSVDPASFRQAITTASGPGYAAPVHLDRVEIGGQDIDGVDALVVRGLGTSLLGQSVLRRLGPVSQDGDRMVIGKP
jgi:aspartyl protease family protein